MSNINKSAFPFQTEQTMEGFSGTKAGEVGLTKLEYASIQIFCSGLPIKKSIKQAKLLLQECEESK